MHLESPGAVGGCDAPVFLQGLWWPIWTSWSIEVVLKSDREPSMVALCDAVKNAWHGENVLLLSQR